MNLLKSALAGAASAVGTHYADEAINPTPHPQWAYFAVAAAGAVGGYYLRNKRPIVAGVLFGVGAGSAYQGYSRSRTAANAAPKPVPPPQTYAPPTYQQQPGAYGSPYQMPPPSSGGMTLPVSAGQLQDIYGKAQGVTKQLENIFGPEQIDSVPYSADDYAADTAEFESDWS